MDVNGSHRLLFLAFFLTLFIPCCLLADTGGSLLTPHSPPVLDDQYEAQDREIISLILGLAVCMIIAVNWRTLRALPSAGWWIAALIVRLTAWSASILESFIWPVFLHHYEHLALTVSTALAAYAAWIAFGAPRGEPTTTS